MLNGKQHFPCLRREPDPKHLHLPQYSLRKHNEILANLHSNINIHVLFCFLSFISCPTLAQQAGWEKKTSHIVSFGSTCDSKFSGLLNNEGRGEQESVPLNTALPQCVLPYSSQCPRINALNCSRSLKKNAYSFYCSQERRQK